MKHHYIIYTLAFIEGGAVMCTELCCAKLMAPYFGTSIYVWAAVLGVTLSALMCGYFWGGTLSSKSKDPKVVTNLLFTAGILIFITPLITRLILPYTIEMGIIAGTICSLIFILFFPLILLGASSPVIINIITDHAADSGKSSGNVYAVSTFGGIITTFAVGFYLLPSQGISITLIFFGSLLIVGSVLCRLIIRKFNLFIFLPLMISCALYAFYPVNDHPGLLHRSEGILGELKIIDRNIYNQLEQKNISYRELMVNNISQTVMNLTDYNKSYWPYVDMIALSVKNYIQGDKALLLGMGGGTLYRKLSQAGIQTDMVEIDKRMEQLSKSYFFLPEQTTIIIDDARHYIKTSSNKYNAIIYDLFNSETPPTHLMSKEAFGEVQKMMGDDGVLLINFYGFLSDDYGKGARSIITTLKACHFNIKLLVTSGEEAYRNLLIIASKNKFKSKFDMKYKEIPIESIDCSDVHVLSDNRNDLEHLYAKAALNWRVNYNKSVAKKFLK